jgi:6-phosphogluconate dehydrogenase
MQIGVVGLGRMGAAIARRLAEQGHRCVVYDQDPAVAGHTADAPGIAAATGIADLVGMLDPPRVIWVMVPASAVGDVLGQIAEHLDPGDTLIDGGNSNYRDSIERAAELGSHGLRFVDVGTSGGVFGASRGYCLMVGGTAEAVQPLEPIFAALAPGVDAARRTGSRTGALAPEERGYLHCGPSGAGHFVKMVHNGVEYGLMAAYAEGFALLDRPPHRDGDPVFDLDTAAVAEVWRRGSVVSSWLLDLTADALHGNPRAVDYPDRVSDSGEGRWALQAATEAGVPTPVLAAALHARFSSQGQADLSNRILSAMRSQFGGHDD